MSHRLRLTAEKVAQRLRLISGQVARVRVPIERFKIEVLPDATVGADTSVFACDVQGPELEWNSYWGEQNLHFVLRSRFTVPRGWRNPALHLPMGAAGDIFTHPEALLYIDGSPVASADRYHHTVDLDTALADGKPHDLLLHGWTGLTGWPPDPTDRSQLFMRECSVIDIDRELQGFLTLAGTALELSEEFNDNRPEKHSILSALDAAFLALDTRDPMGEAFRASVPEATQRLTEGLGPAGPPLDIKLHAIGHAHMDVAYLWPIAQIRQKNARTYSNVLRLMERHPEFKFSHSQPQLYAYTEEDYPEIFDGIKARVAQGRWEILGGMWVEPDANMPGPEALVRQILLARHLSATIPVRRRGARRRCLWLPDTFGFPRLSAAADGAGRAEMVRHQQGELEPVQSDAGLDDVVGRHRWQPGAGAVSDHPARGAASAVSDQLQIRSDGGGGGGHLDAQHGQGPGAHDLLICYGYGDGGGGPTDELIRKATGPLRALPGAPQLVQARARCAGFFRGAGGQRGPWLAGLAAGSFIWRAIAVCPDQPGMDQTRQPQGRSADARCGTGAGAGACWQGAGMPAESVRGVAACCASTSSTTF